MAITPNQSFLVKRMQWSLAAALSYIMWDLGANARRWDGSWNGGPAGNANKALWWPSGWRINKQQFHPRPQRGHTGGPCLVEFSNARFDPERGDIWYGPKRVAENVKVADDAKTKIIKNDTDGIIHVSYEEAVEVTNSFSASISKGVTLDMATEEHAEVTAEQKVSGSYAGVSAEASLSETFGVSASQSKSESKEEGREKSEEGTTSESLAIEFDVKPGEHYLVTISKEHETSYQDFRITGIMDFDLHLHMPKSAEAPGSSTAATIRARTCTSSGSTAWHSSWPATTPTIPPWRASSVWRTRPRSGPGRSSR